MNPFKNISVFRDQDIYTNCSLRPWSISTDDSSCTETTPFPDTKEYKGSPDYYESQLVEINLLTKQLELLKQENDRVQHLTQCLVLQMSKVENNKFPLKVIDKQMKLFDDGGIDGTPRNR
jgi:hypothetical protein